MKKASALAVAFLAGVAFGQERTKPGQIYAPATRVTRPAASRPKRSSAPGIPG